MKKTFSIILAALLCAAPVFADEAVIEEIAADDAGIMLISELEEAVAVDTVVEEVVVDAELINAIAAICGVEVTPEFVEALLAFLAPAVEEEAAEEAVVEEAAEEAVEEEAAEEAVEEEAAEEVVEEEAAEEVVEEEAAEEAVEEEAAEEAVVDVDAVIAIAATYNITLTPELINTVLASGVEVTPAILQNAALMFGAVISEEEAAAVIALLNPVAEEAVVEEVVEEEAVVEEAAEEVVEEELVVVEEVVVPTPAEALYALAAAYGVEINDEFVAQILALVAAVEVEVVAEEELVAVEEEAIAEEVVEEVVEEEPVSKYPVILTKIPGFGLFAKLLSLFTFRG